ncbi:hypothetical protein JYK14_15675 [Siccirubricoccus sp. KC 17139]|uniref:Uncharacterized protein n=1 Tax=Siccirubricoccus soli TaxID=2899147 RepID=A0ABT1D6T6_9PROT|nr:hypothetical protein [Siccirubricoccus soli]MCO6417589.1 hypothetical protein [Siccirubricoccus soli]MCP2683724.1 hypothetical protein [Siccirubricoccus soli]
MIHKALIASIIALGAAGAAQAQSGPRLIGGGEDAMVVYDVASTNRAGGATARVIGGGEDAQYSASATTPAPGLVGTLLGGGENAVVVYQQPSMPASMMAGRGNQPRG